MNINNFSNPLHLNNVKVNDNYFNEYLNLIKNLDIINGSNILLCDDVITTGSTLAECAKMLLDSNAKSVMCVTIANVK